MSEEVRIILGILAIIFLIVILFKGKR